MYNHGFGSSAASGTVELLRHTFPSATVVAFDLPLHPAEALALLREKVATEQPHLIIGTSMGGMFTEMLYGVDRILVNPAFEMAQTLKANGLTGKQQWQNPRQDGEREFLVTKALEKEFAEVTAQNFLHLESLTPEERTAENQRVWGLFGDRDEVVHTQPLFSSHYSQAVRFRGGHRLDQSAFVHGLVPVVRWVDDRQEGRERPVVYVDYTALADAFDRPLSSLQKCVEQLVETYDVFVLAPAPTLAPEQLTHWGSWVDQYLSTPLHNRVVYTDRPALLLGDYCVSRRPLDGFMGTVLELGSDEFRSWEDLITYFARLGGQ